MDGDGQGAPTSKRQSRGSGIGPGMFSSRLVSQAGNSALRFQTSAAQRFSKLLEQSREAANKVAGRTTRRASEGRSSTTLAGHSDDPDIQLLCTAEKTSSARVGITDAATKAVVPVVRTQPAYEVFMLCASPLPLPVNLRTGLVDIHTGQRLSLGAVDFLSEVAEVHKSLRAQCAGAQLSIGVASVEAFKHLLTLAGSCRGLVVHLVAHGIKHPSTDEFGLVLEDDFGGPHILWRRELEGFLRVHERGLRNISLLFLGTCWSEELAQIFVEFGCSHVIAVRRPVHDSAFRMFAKQLYLALAVGQPLLESVEMAMEALRVAPNRAIQSDADSFVIFGQHGAQKATLQTLCDADHADLHGAAYSRSQLTKGFEDAALCQSVAAALPIQEDFTGRSEMIYSIIRLLSQDRRACVVHGPRGVGKSALCSELARISSTPSRIFSCAVVTISIMNFELGNILESILIKIQELKEVICFSTRNAASGSNSARAFGHLTGSPHSPEFTPESLEASDSSGSSCSAPELSHSSGSNTIAGSLDLACVCADICEGLLHVQSRQSSKQILLVVHDSASCISTCDTLRQLLGEFLDRVPELRVLICSREPITQALGVVKVVNVELGGLEEHDAAALFLNRVHRRLVRTDFTPPGALPGQLDVPEGDLSPSQQKQKAIKQLLDHQLLRKLAGNPEQIKKAASRVVPNGPDLFAIAAGLKPNDFEC